MEAVELKARRETQVSPDEAAAGRVSGDEVAEQASVKRWSGLPEKGAAKEAAQRAAGDFEGEKTTRGERETSSKMRDAWRRATGRSIDRIAEIKSPQGREVGKASPSR
jgi:hypothetical protein